MGFFARILSNFLHEAAVNKLASNKTFQNLAVRTVEAQKQVQQLVTEASKDPEKARSVVTESAGTFWAHFRSEMSKDLQRLNASLESEVGKRGASSGGARGGDGKAQ